jgi:hypothetical protein
MTCDLTQTRLKELLTYDPETGVFMWVVNKGPRSCAGSVAGCRGYRYMTIGINKKNHMAHIVAWVYMTGNYPSSEIDHFDGDGFNNKWVNLRPATRKQNMENTSLFSTNTSGYRGVTWYRKNNKWGATAFHNGKRHFAGLHDTAEAAGIAAKALRDKLFTHHHTSHAA